MRCERNVGQCVHSRTPFSAIFFFLLCGSGKFERHAAEWKWITKRLSGIWMSWGEIFGHSSCLGCCFARCVHRVKTWKEIVKMWYIYCCVSWRLCSYGIDKMNCQHHFYECFVYKQILNQYGLELCILTRLANGGCDGKCLFLTADILTLN